MSQGQRLLDVIRQAVDQKITSGAMYHSTPGVVAEDSGGAYVTSAYIQVDELVSEILTEAGAYVSAGDYIMVGITGEGKLWLDRILPSSLYSKLVIDHNRALLGIGDGDSNSFDFGTPGQVLTSNGPALPMEWSDSGGASSAYTAYNVYSLDLTGDVNDLDTSSWQSPALVKLTTGGASRQITGLTGGTEGRTIIFYVRDGEVGFVRFRSENTSSAASNRLANVGFDLRVTNGNSIVVVYDTDISRWIAGSLQGTNWGEDDDIADLDWGGTSHNDLIDETEAARAGHVHALPANPVTAHEAAGDPHTGYRLESADHTHASAGLQGGQIAHSALTGLTTGDDHTQYQKESEKGAADGYASLDSTTKVPTAQLGTGTADNTKYLRGDRAWVAGSNVTHDHSGASDGPDLLPDSIHGTLYYLASGGDDYTALQALIDGAAEGTTIMLPDTLYQVSQELVVNKDNIYFKGRGYYLSTNNATTIKRITNSGNSVIKWTPSTAPPYASAPLVGGGMQNISLDANLLADNSLHVQTAARLNFENISLWNATASGAYLGTRNYDTSFNPYNTTSSLHFKNLFVFVVDTAKGIDIYPGTTTSELAHVPYNLVFDQVFVNHEDGVGIHFRACDDIDLIQYAHTTSGTGNSMEIEYRASSIKFFGGSPQTNGIINANADVNRFANGIVFFGLGTVDTQNAPQHDKGAVVKYVDDWGRHNLNPDPRTYCLMVDDFGGGPTATPNMSELGWSVFTGTTIAYLSSEANHPGIRSIDTGSTINTVAGIGLMGGGSPGLLLPSEAFEGHFIFRIPTSIADLTARIGFVDANGETTDPPSHGIYLEYTAGTDTNWQSITRSSGTQTKNDTGVAVSAGGWVRVRIRRRTPGDIGFAIGNVTNQDDTFSQWQNVPTAVLNPVFLIKNNVASSKIMHVDYFQFNIIGLNR